MHRIVVFLQFQGAQAKMAKTNFNTMREHKTLEIGPKKKMSYYNKMYGAKNYIAIIYIIALILVISANSSVHGNYAEVIESKQDSLVSKRLTKIRYIIEKATARTKVKEQQRAHDFSKPIGVVNREQQDESLIRLRRYINPNTGNNVTQKQMESSNEAATNPINYYAPAIKCQEYQNNCTLYCTNGSVSFLDENINYFKPKCPNTNLSLKLAKCEFNFGILQQSFFYYAAVLALLSINECNLQTIKETTFQHQNAKSLHTLILVNNQLITFKDTTFEGLANLNFFEFVQNPLSTIFQGEAFLQPLAIKLKEAVIQPHVNASEVSDPLSWWRDLKINGLVTLDLSNTNLRGVLSSTTFQAFQKLQVLKLFNCNLSSVAANVFDFITNDFKYLDLQLNHLKLLDSSFLQKMLIPGLEIKLNSNEWCCECEAEMWQYFVINNVSLSQDLVCSSPDEWLGIESKQFIKVCEQQETTTDTLATSEAVSSFATSATKASSTEHSMATYFPTSADTSLVPYVTETTTKVTVRPNTGSEVTASPPTDQMAIECFGKDNKTEKFWLHIVKPKIKFTLNTLSATSLVVTIDAANILPHFAIIYFTNYTDYNYITELKSYNYIHDVQPSVAYVICLIGPPVLTVSPFDCQTYFTIGNGQNTTWLLKDDKIWFITLFSIVSILLFFGSGFSTYKLLHYKPDWLLKCIQSPPQAKHSSGKYLINMPNSSNEQLSCQSSAVSQESLHYLTFRSSLLQDHETVAPKAIYYSHHGPPLTRAPHVPPSKKFCEPSAYISRSTSTNSACEINSQANVDYLNIVENDPVYQTIDYYESINNRGNITLQ